MRESTKQNLRLVIRIVALAVLASAVYGYFVGEDNWLSAFRGAVKGSLIAVPLVVFEVLVMPGPIGAPIRGLPFVAHIGVKSLIYLTMILAGLMGGSRLLPSDLDHAGIVFGVTAADLAFSFALVFVGNFIMAISQLLGPNVLLAFVTGRYHQPRIERRLLLFIDMKDSTAAAERIGPLQFHRLLNRYYRDLGKVIVDHRGQIHKYVGDEMIVTWRAEDGRSEERCVEAVLEARRLLSAAAPFYQRGFGLAPQFRAALHVGEVVSGEMGDVRKEIVLLGDPMNTAARIMDACRETGEDFLISGPVADRLAAIARIPLKPVAHLPLRGKSEPLSLYALGVP